MPEIVPFNEPKLDIPQGNHEILPRLSFRGLVQGPSNSGKTVLVVRLLVDPQFYRGAFDKIYVFSPTASSDPGMDPLREYVKTLQNQSVDPTFHDILDVKVVQDILDRATKVTKHLKERKEKFRPQILLYFDDFCDNQAVMHKCGSILDTLYIRGRHANVSVLISSQRLKLVSSVIRVNLSFIIIFRLRNNNDLKDGVMHEFSALIPAKKLMQIYLQATKKPFSFLYINLQTRKGLNHMFYNSFNTRFVLDDEEDE